MTYEAPNWYQTKYNDNVSHVFQSKGNLLRGMVTPPVEVNGNELKFFVSGKGEAEPLQRGGKGSAMNLAKNTVTGIVKDWQAADWIYETDSKKVPVKMGDVLSKAVGAACGRKKDRIIIDEINSMPGLSSVDATNGGANTNANSPFTLLMAITACRILQSADVDFDDGNVFCGLPAQAWNQFISYKQVNSADWCGYDGLPYKTGAKLKDWNGVKWFRQPDSYCPVTATGAVDFFMWHKSAIGSGDNYETRTDVTWENLYSGWYHNTRFADLAKVILPAGIVRMRYGGNASPITLN